jgi:hypothetical protein
MIIGFDTQMITEAVPVSSSIATPGVPTPETSNQDIPLPCRGRAAAVRFLLERALT